jgi:putative two-component system response regulator
MIRGRCMRGGWGGYPDALRAGAIALPARIVALADVFDVLTHERSYGVEWTHERARAHIEAEREHQFDPQLADAFLALDPRSFAGSASEPPLEAAA